MQQNLPNVERFIRLTGRELLHLGVSKWQINEWTRRGIVQAPIGKAHRRGAPGHTCDIVEAATISVLGRLRGARYRLDTLSSVAPAVRRHFRDRGPTPVGYLVTDGLRAFIDSDARAARIAAGLGKCATVDLGAEWARCLVLLSSLE